MIGIGAEHARRREAARRLPDGDPWVHGLRDEDQALTPAKLAAWTAAANHIAADGVTPILPVEVLRALYRRGGVARQLAERIAANGGTAT